jgi:hypothetical protein
MKYPIKIVMLALLALGVAFAANAGDPVKKVEQANLFKICHDENNCSNPTAFADTAACVMYCQAYARGAVPVYKANLDDLYEELGTGPDAAIGGTIKTRLEDGVEKESATVVHTKIGTYPGTDVLKIDATRVFTSSPTEVMTASLKPWPMAISGYYVDFNREWITYLDEYGKVVPGDPALAFNRDELLVEAGKFFPEVDLSGLILPPKCAGCPPTIDWKELRKRFQTAGQLEKLLGELDLLKPQLIDMIISIRDKGQLFFETYQCGVYTVPTNDEIAIAVNILAGRIVEIATSHVCNTKVCVGEPVPEQ